MFPIMHRKNNGPDEGTGLALQRDFDNLRQDLFRMFDGLPSSWLAWPESVSRDGLTATYPLDISEENGSIQVDAELPGFSKDQIEISVDNGMLHICAERESEERKGKKHLQERQYRRIERKVTLPAGVDEGKSKATYKDGVLHLELPKSEEAKTHQIKVS